MCVCVCVRVCACMYVPRHVTLPSVPLILGHRFTGVNSQSSLIYPKSLVLQMINTENENWAVTCLMSCNALMTKPGLKHKSPDCQFCTLPSLPYLALGWCNWDTPPRSHHSQLLSYLCKIYLFIFFKQWLLPVFLETMSWNPCPIPTRIVWSLELACIKQKPLPLWRQIPDEAERWAGEQCAYSHKRLYDEYPKFEGIWPFEVDDSGRKWVWCDHCDWLIQHLLSTLYQVLWYSGRTQPLTSECTIEILPGPLARGGISVKSTQLPET